MRRMLAEGVVRARRALKAGRVMSPERIYPLMSRTLKNGWHYQVDMSGDRKGQTVTVYAFKPPLRMNARGADYFLLESLTK